MSDEEMNDPAIIAQQNFTPIHSNKRLPQPVCFTALCPTMDLIAIGLRKKKVVDSGSNNYVGGSDNGGDATTIANTTTSNTTSTIKLENNISYSNSITVYRTMSWQKMFVVTETDLSNALSNQYIIENTTSTNTSKNKSNKNQNPDNTNDQEETSSSSSSSSCCVSQLSWSPDGRTLVLGLNNGSLLLYDIESSASPGVPPKPVVYLPTPPQPPLSSSNTTGMNHDNDDNDDDDNHNTNLNNRQMGKSSCNNQSTKRSTSTTSSNNYKRKENNNDDEEDGGSLSSMLSTSTTSPMSTKSISMTTTMTNATNTTISSSTTTNVNNNNVFSPAVTRSMAAARRKQQQQQLQQQGQKAFSDPSEEKSITNMTTTTETSSIPSSSYTKQTSNLTIQDTSNVSPTKTIKIQQTLIESILFETQDKNTIISLQWQRLHPIYKNWNPTTTEENENVSWSFQSHYLDKATHFLPPCAYNATYPINRYTNFDDELFLNGGNSMIGYGGGAGVGSGSTIGGRRETSENFDHHNDFEDSIDRYRPKCETTLSILFSVTAGNGIHLYLQGRYRLVSLPSPMALCNQSTSIQATSDLSCILISVKESCCDWMMEEHHDGQEAQNDYNNPRKHDQQHQPSSALVMYSIPSINQKRYQLQTITSSYCSIMSHLTTIHNGMKEASNVWSSALRQLDMKFDQLSTLLLKYGVLPSTCTTTIEKMTVVRMELLNYILGGHSKRSTDTSNAMDQFFTNVQMNDQLLQRLIRPLEANVAGVEGIIRKKMLGPVRALMYDVGELHGFVNAMNVESCGYNKYDDEDHDDDEYHDDLLVGEGDDLPLMNEHTSLRLYEASEVLYFVAQQCVTQIVEMRIRLNSMMKWIRGTASQVKARGTAMDSVQRENARKRRVPEQIVRKIADFLSTTLKTEGGDDFKRGSSECVLGILFSDYFNKDKVCIDQPPTPLKQKTINKAFGKNSVDPIETPSVKAALELSTQIALDLFEEPRISVTKTAIQNRIYLEEYFERSPSMNLVTSIHNRIGAAANSPDEKNCFNPSIIGNKSNIRCSSRHWIIVANTCSSSVNSKQILQISALPKDRIESQGMNLFEEAFNDNHQPFYLTSFICLPANCHVMNIVFYGDDGNSTLTSETSPNNEEGRQTLGLLLRNSSSEDNVSEELWLFSYEDIDYRMVTISENNLNENKITIKRFNASCDTLCFLTNDSMMEEDESTINARWRQIRDGTNLPPSRLVVSGTRGIGSITSEKVNAIDIFDLEEDECEDESDEEE